MVLELNIKSQDNGIMEKSYSYTFVNELYTKLGENENTKDIRDKIKQIAETHSLDAPGFFRKMWDAITEWLSSYIGLNIEKGVSGQALVQRECTSFVKKLEQERLENTSNREINFS